MIEYGILERMQPEFLLIGLLSVDGVGARWRVQVNSVVAGCRGEGEGCVCQKG